MEMVAEAKISDYEWFISNGICYRCRKNKLAPNRKSCFDCLAVGRNRKPQKYTEEEKQEILKKNRLKYREKKERGICVRCSKKATHGIYCLDCSIKSKKQHINTSEKRKRRRHELGLISQTRIENGMCIKCGKQLSQSDKESEYKMCVSCRNKLKEYAIKGNENHPWRKSESERHNKNRRWRDEHIHTTLQETK